MDACADRPGESGTWISNEFKAIYGQLHTQGKAHSVEVWVDGELAGGLYGVHLGGAFFAESMFHRHTNMSKVALAKEFGISRETVYQYLRAGDALQTA